MKYVPDWWEFALLALAAWRVFHLLAFDDLFDRPRRYVTRLGKKWQKDGDELPKGYRMRLATFITCPYCFGAWLSLGIYLFWIWLPTPALAFATVCALNAGVIAGNRFLSSE